MWSPVAGHPLWYAPPPCTSPLGPWFRKDLSFISLPFPPGSTPQAISIQYHILSSFHFHCLDSCLATSRLMLTSAIQLLVLKTPGVVVILELVTILAGVLFTLLFSFLSIPFTVITCFFAWVVVLEKQARYMYLQLFVLSCLILRVIPSPPWDAPQAQFPTGGGIIDPDEVEWGHTLFVLGL